MENWNIISATVGSISRTFNFLYLKLGERNKSLQMSQMKTKPGRHDQNNETELSKIDKTIAQNIWFAKKEVKLEIKIEDGWVG